MREQKKQSRIEDEVGADSTERGFVGKNGQRRSFALSPGLPTLPTLILPSSYPHPPSCCFTHSLLIVPSP